MVDLSLGHYHREAEEALRHSLDFSVCRVTVVEFMLAVITATLTIVMATAEMVKLLTQDPSLRVDKVVDQGLSLGAQGQPQTLTHTTILQRPELYASITS